MQKWRKGEEKKDQFANRIAGFDSGTTQKEKKKIFRTGLHVTFLCRPSSTPLPSKIPTLILFHPLKYFGPIQTQVEILLAQLLLYDLQFYNVC